MARKRKVFERRPDELQSYLEMLEELAKKDRGGGLYEGYDVDPRAFIVSSDRVADPSGLGQDRYSDPVRFSQYQQTSIPFEAPNLGQVQGYDFQMPEMDYSQYQNPRSTPDRTTIQAEPNSHEELAQYVEQMISYPVTRTQDGGLLMSDGSVRYNDGSIKQATEADIPRVLKEFSDGSVMLTDGTIFNPNTRIGNAYQGTSGLSNLLFGRQQTVTQDYGNYNPKFYRSGRHQGTDYRTRDLDEGFTFAFPFDTKVVQVINADSGSPYGNSILLELPDGSKLRLSHLNEVINAQPGTTIRPFDFIGTPGNTGLSTGEHLDVEYYNPEGMIDSPNNFFLKAEEYVDWNQVGDALKINQENWTPEERAFARAAQDLINEGIEASPSPDMIQQYMQEDMGQQEQIQQIEQPMQDLGQNIQQGIEQVGQAFQPMSPQRQQLASGVADVAQKSGLGSEWGASEYLESGDPEVAKQARISALSQQPKTPYEERDFLGKLRQLAGNVTERIGDTLGVPEGAFSETLAGGSTKRTGQALASQIGGQAPEQVPGIRQNIRDIGQDLAEKAQGFIGQAGEGIESLKEKGVDAVSNLFRKEPMEIDKGQKQVGDVRGTSLFEGTAKTAPTDIRDAFFKFGGADEFSKYLVDSAEEKKGGALGTDLFSKEFYQDPNRIANVFGQTSMGQEATGKYKDYLGSNVKEGFDEPYRTEVREEGDYLVEYKIPVKEYWENKYWQDQISQTPDVLKSDFSYDKFQMPTTQRTEGQKGERTPGYDLPTIFKSGAVDLFRKAGTEVAKKAKDVNKPLADVYRSATPGGKIPIPSASQSIFSIPSSRGASTPKQTSRVIRLSPAAQARQSQSSGRSSSQQISERTSSPSVSSQTPTQQRAQQFAQRATSPQKLSSWTRPPVTARQQAQADMRNPSVYKSTSDWVRLLMQR